MCQCFPNYCSVWNKGCKIPSRGLARIIGPNYKPTRCFSPILNGMSSVTSYIRTVTLTLLKKYAPELALPASYYRILLTVTFQMNNDRYRVYLRPVYPESSWTLEVLIKFSTSFSFS